jgi:hypothetical protein
VEQPLIPTREFACFARSASRCAPQVPSTMSRPTTPPASRPVAWALLSQAIWLPLLAVDLQDRWSARLQDLTPRPGNGTTPLVPGPVLASAGPSLSLPRGPSASALVQPGLLLGSSSQSRASGMAAITGQVGAPAGPNILGASRGSAMASERFQALVPQASGAIALFPSGATPAALTLQQAGYTRAELLGGPITLADLQEGTLPPMALAEQGRRTLSGDPLATLPEPWREPMRQALATLPSSNGASARLEPARHIHVPSSRVSRPTEVPLALQPDGSVDILSRPDNDAVVEEIRDWSARQAPPAAGSVAPALVHLHPVAEPQLQRPSAADLADPAAPPAAGARAASATAPLALPTPAPVAAPPTAAGSEPQPQTPHQTTTVR